MDHAQHPEEFAGDLKMSDAIDRWLDSTCNRSTRLFKRWNRLNELHKKARARWGGDDKRTKWYHWRLEKFNLRDSSNNSTQNELYEVLFEDPKFKKFDVILRKLRMEPTNGLRKARKKYGVSFPRK